MRNRFQKQRKIDNKIRIFLPVMICGIMVAVLWNSSSQIFRETKKRQEESLKETLEKVLEHTGEIQILRTSTIDPSSENSGMEELEETIRNMFFEGKLRHNNELVVTNLRHKEALQDALNSLQLVEQSIEDGMPEDFYSIDLTSAYASLGKIIGEEVDEDVVNEIFSKFCMGK